MGIVEEVLADSMWDDWGEESVKLLSRDGGAHEFDYAIDLVTDLVALLLECKVNGSIPLGQLRDDADDHTVTITATRGEQNAMNKALADFSVDPLAYDLHDMVPDEDMKEMARDRRLRLWKALIKLGREKLSQ